MTLLALGINHDTASIDVREQLAFSQDEYSRASEQAIADGLVSEIAILSTCNRTEIYCDAQVEDTALIDWLAKIKNVQHDALKASSYIHIDLDAVHHMMKVASGLDSLVLGEPQILGQMKTSYAQAEQNQAIGSKLHHVFQRVFSVAKRVRSETSIGENPVSVAFAAVSLAQQIFSDLEQASALLVGAGETIDLVARHLHEHGIGNIMVANRSLERARMLAETFNGEALMLPNIPDYLPKADIVISSTASPLPLIGKGMVERALKIRKHKPMFMVDIAVPRDIESQVSSLHDVFLYSVDDLREVIDENKRSRQEAAQAAHLIIKQSVEKFSEDQKSLESVDVIKAFRRHVSEIAESELEKAFKYIRSGQNPEEVLQRFSYSLANKFMHEPTSALKRASIEKNAALSLSMEKLFLLNDSSKKR